MRAQAMIFIGAGLGALTRYGMNALAASVMPPGFPWGIFLVNGLGSFCMGLLVGWLALACPPAWQVPLQSFVGTGFLGGFTTFSTFSLDAVALAERGAWGGFFAYALGSVLLGVGACWLGLTLTRSGS